MLVHGVEQLVSRVALALGIGLLIGLERGWRMRTAESGSRAAGIRTFAILGLLGGIVGAIAQIAGGVTSAGGGIVLAGSLAVYAVVITAFSREENRAAGTFSATTAIAGMLTFSLGAYAMIGDVRIAAAAAVAAAAILALREELHGWVARITWLELRSGLVLLAMTFIALPIVPDDRVALRRSTQQRVNIAHCRLLPHWANSYSHHILDCGNGPTVTTLGGSISAVCSRCRTQRNYEFAMDRGSWSATTSPTA